MYEPYVIWFVFLQNKKILKFFVFKFPLKYIKCYIILTEMHAVLWFVIQHLTNSSSNVLVVS